MGKGGFKVLNISENITLNGSVTVENKQLVSMIASINTDINGYPNVSITILDKEGYKDNYHTCKQGINEFLEKVLNKQYEVLGGVINEAK